MWLNTAELKEKLTGKNKSFITRVSNHQEKKYGNVDIFDAIVHDDGVNISIGERHIHFFFSADGEVTGTNGNGSKYAAQLEDCAIELYHKLIMKGE